MTVAVILEGRVRVKDSILRGNRELKAVHIQLPNERV